MKFCNFYEVNIFEMSIYSTNDIQSIIIKKTSILKGFLVIILQQIKKRQILLKLFIKILLLYAKCSPYIYKFNIKQRDK